MEVRSWTYEEFPEFSEEVPGAHYFDTTGDEIGVRYFANVPVAVRDGFQLDLQLLVPRTRNAGYAPHPAVAYVQGSGWHEQNVYQEIPQLALLARRGYTVAVVRYRHAALAHFPAQIEDALAAVRFMRAHAQDLYVDPQRIALAGSSSGGHTAVLAAIVDAEMRAQALVAGEEPDTSAAVAGVIDLYGAVSLMRPDGFPTTLNHHTAASPEGQLMGCDLTERPDLCRLASAPERITAALDLPPTLIVHGAHDRTVWAQLSVDLFERLRATGHSSELYLLRGADHGGPEFFTEGMIDIYDAFLRRVFS